MKFRLYVLTAIVVCAFIIPFYFQNSPTSSAEEDFSEPFQTLEIDDSNPVSTDGILAGTENGLFFLRDGQMHPLWTEGAVQTIVHTDAYYMITDKGIVKTKDLLTYDYCNNGLPTHRVKHYEDGQVSFTDDMASLKDLGVHPENSSIMVTTSNNAVYLTENGGESWKNIGFSSTKTSGAKAVAVCNMPDASGNPVLTVFLSHSVYGIAYYQPYSKKPAWIDMDYGFERVPTSDSSDEIADILPVLRLDENGNYYTEVYISQSFKPCIYRLDWTKKQGQLLGKTENPAQVIDSLFLAGENLIFITMDGYGSFNLKTKTFEAAPKESETWLKAVKQAEGQARCMYIPESASGYSKSISLNELWLLDTADIAGNYVETASDRKALYIPAGQTTPGKTLQGFIDTAKENGLNAIVVDMKDDYGYLRYHTISDEVKKKATESSYAINLDAFVDQCKEADLYLIARIVVFKDRNLWRYSNGKYAVKDSSSGKAWQGIRGYSDILDENGVKTGSETEYYDEYWCDPYCHEVWEYNVSICKELIERGFDEIQFDYIRFPTDGLNLSRAQYKWQDEGMDKESALMSFLSYARANIDAPIGIDIYGANGWYRYGGRTGQDVELLAEYVDVICPMFYPSHFEQSFFAYSPAEERTYRIYYYGCFRNSVIARNKVIVRPWVQAFYLAVSYDKLYYDKDYVRRQVFGTRDSIDRGYMYWNNSGKYNYISPDPGDAPYPWKGDGITKTGLFRNSASEDMAEQLSE
ncbi:MAG: hypothetical protein MJ183_02140 [Treponemataceae bacterium]|nr:hypothetical protein [Treponemataceae bacterium]